MAKFTGDLRVQAHGTDEWKLLAPLTYTTGITGRQVDISVPTGFVNDLASIPRIFQSIVPKVAKHRRAAVIHDYLYANKGKLGYAKFTRKQADQVFLEAMKVDGVRWTRRRIMYMAVRAGGWTYWRE